MPEASDQAIVTTLSPSRTPSVVVVLLNETTLLKRGKQPRGGRLVEPQTASEFCDSGLSVRLPESYQERSSTIDGPYSIAIQHYPTPPGLGANGTRDCSAATFEPRRFLPELEAALAYLTEAPEPSAIADWALAAIAYVSLCGTGGMLT
jgi:hypothetical protein